MKFRIARESEFENARGRQNPLRGTAWEDRAQQMPDVLSTWLIEIADLVTEMTEVKHPFRAGVKAQAGIEF